VGLRDGIEQAITALGAGFLAQTSNVALHRALGSGELDRRDYFRQLLRLVFRLIFWFVTEDRGMPLDRKAAAAVIRLRRRAAQASRSRQLDLWRGLRTSLRELSTDEGLADLIGAELANEDLLAALRSLDFDWCAIGVAELGGVYESLLDLHPKLDRERAGFELQTGHERKSTGSYYTPDCLVSCLLDNALEPVLDAKVCGKSREHAEAALLDTTVCDPACGSGHFLVAAAQRIARRLAGVRGGDDAFMPALRDVISRCIHGVDVNPMAIELCKIALWLEARDPDRPLSHLDAHIQCGNSLLGFSWPEQGFDVVLGNPPWERVKAQEKEFFADSDLPGAAEVANSETAGQRKANIEGLAQRSGGLWQKWHEHLRKAAATLTFARESGEFPLSARGDINTYALFVELATRIVSATGRVGMIVPTGLITDVTTAPLFHSLVANKLLVSAYDFENRKKLFRAVDSRLRFLLLTIAGKQAAIAASPTFGFALHSPNELADPSRVISLSEADIACINPNSRTCPIFLHQRDADIARKVYRRIPVLRLQADPTAGWGMQMTTMYHGTTDARLLRPQASVGREPVLPLWEGKMIGMYDHRAADIAIHAKNAKRKQQPSPISELEHGDPRREARAYLAAPESETRRRAPQDWPFDWYLVIKRVSAATNWRTIVATIIPRHAVSNTLYITRCDARWFELVPCLLASLNSFAFDYFVRQKTSQPSLPIGVIHESPLPGPEVFLQRCPWDDTRRWVDWIKPRVLELIYTSDAMRTVARDWGHEGEPFAWDPERRMHLLAELDVAMFQLYGLDSGEVEHVLATFGAFGQREVRKLGSFVTRTRILAMTEQRALDTQSTGSSSG
jgi:hypothetical protein